MNLRSILILSLFSIIFISCKAGNYWDKQNSLLEKYVIKYESIADRDHLTAKDYDEVIKLQDEYESLDFTQEPTEPTEAEYKRTTELLKRADKAIEKISYFKYKLD